MVHAVLHKFYLKQQIEVRWILLTKLTLSGKVRVARSFLQGTGKFTVERAFSHKLYVTQWEYFFQVVVFFSFLTKDGNFRQFGFAHTVLYKSGKFEDVSTFLT